VLGGVLRALAEQPIVRDTLDLVTKDPKLWAIFPKLISVKKLTRDDLSQLVTLIREKKIPSKDLLVLCYGSVTDSLSPEDVESTLYPLARDLAEAVVPVYQVYGMYMFRNRERWEMCRAVVRELILYEGFLEQLAGSRDEYLWSEL